VKLTADLALQLAAEGLKVGALLCAPLLGLILAVGLAISVLQVITQVQDPSISFVPKLAAFVVALVLLGPWMLGKLVSYGTTLFERLAHLQ
jgi:flagellar biosynthesis protein FliQ